MTLRRMSLERLQQLYDNNPIVNPEARKRLEKKKKEDEEIQRRLQVRYEQIDDELAKEKEEKKKAEEFRMKVEKARKDYERIQSLDDQVYDLDRDEEILDKMLIDVSERTEDTRLDVESSSEIIKWEGICMELNTVSTEIRIQRKNGDVSFHKSMHDILKRVTSYDVYDMYKIGMKKDVKLITVAIEKHVLEWLQMMFEPEKYSELFLSHEDVRIWKHFARAGVHCVSFKQGEYLYMLEEREYVLSTTLLEKLVEKKLHAAIRTGGAKNILYRVLNQFHKRQVQMKKKSPKKN